MQLFSRFLWLCAIFGSFQLSQANHYCCELELQLQQAMMAKEITTVIQISQALENEC